MSSKTMLDAEGPPVLIPLEPAPRRGGFRLRHLMYAVLYCALVCWLGVMTGLLLLSGLLGLLFAIVFGGVLIFSRRRSTQQDALLWALAIAAERGMPLAPTFEAFAGQCRGGYRRKVLDAADHLRHGATLPQVLDRVPRLFPRDAEVLIRVGSASGVPAAAFRESSTWRAATRGPWVALAVRLSYLVWTLVVLQAVMGFVSYFILPKYEAIFADFGIPLPAITVLTIEATHFLVVFWPIYVLLLLFLLGILMVLCVSVLGVLPWDLPLFGRFFLRRHSALVLRCLARVVEGNKPLDQGLATLARSYPATTIRQRLRRVTQDVQQGDDWCEALARHGLIRPAEAVLLESARRAGNLAWALREAAENSERRFMYRLQLLAYWLLPLVVMAIGALVFVVAVSYFTPLISLLQKLA